MKTRWNGMGMLAAGLALAVTAILAGFAGAARSDIRVESRAESSGAGPEIHIWINDKEITVGGPAASDPAPPQAESGEEAAEHQAPEPATAYLGVMLGPVMGEVRKQVKEGGARVMAVMPNSSAAKAGLQAGDIITAMDGKAVEGPQKLAEGVRGHKPGDKVKVTFVRDGKEMTETVTLDQAFATGPGERPVPPGAPGRHEAEGFLGVTVSPITKEVMEVAGIDHGVLVSSMMDGSPAAKAGLLPVDVITSIDGKDVSTPDQLLDAIRSHKPGDAIGVVYYRAGKRAEAKITLAARPEERRRPEGMRHFEVPEELYQEVPQLRRYLEELGRGMERRGEGWRFEIPSPHVAPVPPPAAPYEVGRDIGRILERLDRIEKRLDAIEKRLDRLEKK